jgi:hypothetical protein
MTNILQNAKGIKAKRPEPPHPSAKSLPESGGLWREGWGRNL